MINRSMDLTSDDELLRQARHFDLPSLSAIYDRFNNGLYYYALRLLSDTALAEDCVSETFSQLLKVLKSGGGPRDNLKSYLYRCVHNWVTDYYRRKPTLTLDLCSELPDPEDSPSQQTEQNIACQRLRAALRKLTPDQRQVITLHFIEGWDITEVAESLKKPVGAVKSLQHRALASLQRLLLEKEKV
jgi:RNA polymerase sigma-70 factor (ECF subfamily)